METIHLTRQLDLIKTTALNKKITVIGAGAIGSFTVLTLAKMGYNNITVYDGDTIDPENMNCQFYPMAAIGDSKVNTLSKLVWDYTGIRIKDKAIHFDPDKHGFIRGEIVISAVDSMKVRKMIYEYTMANHLLDARMGAEYILMYHAMMDSQVSRSNYEATLYGDAEAVQERCTAKATMYTVNLIAGLLGKAVKDITTETIKPLDNINWNVAKNSAVWFTDGTKLTL